MSVDLWVEKPNNVRAYRGALVTSDVFHIAERVREIDPALYVHVLDPPVHFDGRVYHFAICELGPDRVERLVFRAEELDSRILKKLEYIRAVPFEKRFAEAEKWEAAELAKRKDDELTALYERMGRPMWTQLEHDGFIQRPVSYPKRGVKPGAK
jgi:hypothetical protein